jgi:hypothetical protein
MTSVALPPPGTLSPAERAAEITTILATAIVRSVLAVGATETEVRLGFLPEQRVHTTPYREERL